MVLDNHNRELCNKCNTLANFNSDFGFYKCPACEYTWAYAEDDPDLDELIDSCPYFEEKTKECMNKGYAIMCDNCPKKNLN